MLSIQQLNIKIVDQPSILNIDNIIDLGRPKEIGNEKSTPCDLEKGKDPRA